MTCKIGMVVVVAWFLAPAFHGATAEQLCGAVVTSDVTLDEDLACPGDGLVVGADRIRVDLNGHTLSGSGTGVGLLVTGRHDVLISGGTVRNFAVAVRVSSSTEVVIKDNAFSDNRETIDFQAGSIGNRVKGNTFQGSPVRAIMLRGDVRLNEIKDNTFTGNRVAILVFAGVDNILKDNVISGSSLAGIRLNVFATGNVLKDNTLSSNEAGIEFLIADTGSATGNELKDNKLLYNVCGVKGPTAGNTLKDNEFTGNTADGCS